MEILIEKFVNFENLPALKKSRISETLLLCRTVFERHDKDTNKFLIINFVVPKKLF